MGRIRISSRRHLLAAYAVWITLLIVAYYRLPGLRVGAWGLLGLSGVLAIVAGTFINRPARKLPWFLLAGANLSFVAGQVSFLVITQVIATTVPFPSFADILYLLTYPLYAAGLLIFIWWRTAGSDRRSLIDALTLTVGLALLSWLYLVIPYFHNPALSWIQRSVAIAYPLGDVLVLAMLARLLTPGTVRTRSVQLLTLGTIGMLVSDVSFGLMQLHGSFRSGTLADLGWAVFYAAWGAAALHPTMAELTRPVARQQATVSPLRLTLLMLASLIAPAVLLAQSLQGQLRDASVIAVFSAILYLLVLSRLWDTATSHHRALDRERAVRVAGASLTSAATVEDVSTDVRIAATTLISPPSRSETMLVVRSDDMLRAFTTAYGDPAQTQQLGQLAGTWLPLITGSGPLLMPAAKLGVAETELLHGADGVLLCPLRLEERPSGDPLIGVLAVFGGQRILADLSATFEILAHQAAMAIERIMLSREVIRQGNEAYFRTLVQDTSDAILIIGDRGEVRYATPSAKAVFGDVRIEGMRLWNLVQDGRDVVMQALARMRNQTGDSSYDEWRIVRRDGERVQIQVRCSDLRSDVTVRGLVLTLRDVTEQRQLENTLKHRAFHDSLSGLPNRLLFQDRAAHGLARARREGTTMGVLFVDLDDFKVVNDTMGHGVGDELLVAAGMRLSAVVRDSDTTARLGGDEFALLIENVADSAGVEAFAERIVRAFSEPFLIDSGSSITTATVGVATTEDSSDVDDLLRHADLALYAAKAAGKRRWRRYQPVLSAGLMRRRELQEALQEAVVTSAFTLVYQPIVALASGEILGFEALVRWRHPQWGMIYPDQFIDLAEETGQIVPIGAWVLGQAAADLTRWQRRRAHQAPLYASVNVSARQFREPGFVTCVQRVLAESGLAPSSLMLELTESMLLRRDEGLRCDLVKLKAIGVRLAIDDFGTGYSSLSYLEELPVDVLKIDKSFVDRIATSQQRRALVEGILGIARTHSLEAIAEGIENEVQRDLLVSIGCQTGQGYALAMPLAPEEAEALVKNARGVIPGLSRLGGLAGEAGLLPGGCWRLAVRGPL